MLSFSQVVPEGFEVFTVNASIDNTTSVISEIGSALDSENKVHVAYIERTTGNAPKLRYFIYDNGAISNHTSIDIPTTPAQVLSPVIEVGEDDNPHIVVIVKREATSSIRSGNFGVYYAGSEDGGATFSVSQVSTNPENPLIDDENMYNCYVNGRPKIRIIDNVPWVYYFSDFFVNKHYVVFATKNGTSWDRFQEFTYNQTNFNEPSVDFDASFIPSSLGNIVAWNDFGNYVPKYAIKTSGVWQITNMPEYGGTFANRSVSLSSTNDGETHMIFKNELGDFDKFIHIKINNVGDYEEVNRFEFDFLTGGNIFPATIDPVTKKPFAFAKRSFSDFGYLYTLDDSGQPLKLEFSVGNSPGQYTLDAHDGYVAMVTAGFDDDKIFVVTGRVQLDPLSLSADFSASPLTVNINEEVNFTDSSSGSPIAWSWIFDGGTPETSTDQHPTVMYDTPGSYNVSLMVSDAGGNTSTTSKTSYISVNEPASNSSIVSFFSFDGGTLQDNIGANSLSVVGGGFTTGVDGQETSAYRLGPNDYLQLPVGLLNGSNEFSMSIWLKFSGINGSTSDPMHSILSGANPLQDDEVLLRYEPNGSLLCPERAFALTYGGVAGPAVGNDPNCANVSETFNELGWHHVVLSRSGDTTNIYLDNVEIGHFGHSSAIPDIHGLVIGQDQDAVLGGFNPDKALNGVVDEIYFFNVAISSSQVDSLFLLKTTETTELDADFGVSEQSILAGESVTFTDSTSGSPNSWSWSFPGGDPATSTEQNPVVTYLSAGQYDVSLTALDPDGNSSIETKIGYITVEPASISASLQSYYSLDNASLENSTGTNTLEVSGGGFSAGVMDEANSAFQLGVSDYMSLPVDLMHQTDQFSISLWMKLSAINGTTIDPFHTILSGANSLQNDEILLKWEPLASAKCPNAISLTYKGEAGPTGTEDFNCALVGEDTDMLSWHHLVLTRMQGTSRIYLDKTLIGEFTHTADTLQIEGLVIGQDQDGVFEGFDPDQSLNGSVDEIYFFDTEIRPAQVDSLFGLKSGETPQLIAGFIADGTDIEAGASVSFIDQSEGSPDAWQWHFSGGTPDTSNEQNPEIFYSMAGEYDVMLVASRGAETDSLVMEGYITVTEGGTGPVTEVTEITEVWANYIAEEGNSDGFTDIAMDADGNFYATGVSITGSGNTTVESVVVVKAGNDGEQVYYKAIVNNGYQYHEDNVSEIDVDNSGNVYLVTSLEKLVGGSIPDDYFLISLDAEGTERWRVVHDSYNFGYYSAQWDNKLAILNSGTGPSGPGINIAHMTIFDTSSGTVASSSTLNIGSGNIDIGQYFDLYGSYRTETRLDQRNGDIVFGVTHAGTGANGRDIQLRKVSATGELWEKKLDSDRSLSQDELISLKTDASGNVYVLARMVSIEGVSTMSLIKLNDTLSELWKVDFVAESSSMTASSMDFDSNGNVVVSGVDQVFPFVAKVTPAGATIWSERYDTLSNGAWRGHKVMVTNSDKLILVANKQGVGSAPMSFILLDKDGKVLQTRENDYTANQENFINRVAFDKADNAVFVGGWARDDSGVKSLYYAKYLFPETFAQTLTFEALTDVVETIGEIELVAEASSGLPVVFTVEGPATIEGSTLVITGPGQVTVTAAQPGNDDYVDAEAISYTFCVFPATPEITTEETAQGVLLTSSADEGNVWYFDGLEIEGAGENVYLATESGVYEVKVVVDTCESSTSDELEVTVSPVLGLPDVSTNGALKLYPNPVTGILYVDASQDEAIRSVAVYSVTGVEVLHTYDKTPKGAKWEIDATSLVPGIYLLKISTDSGEYSSRVIKE